MNQFELFASPWWVNLAIIFPCLLFFYFRTNKLSLNYQKLFYTAVFAIALGVIESSVIVYLRAALDLLPGYKGSLQDVQNMVPQFYNQQVVLQGLPQSLLTIEMAREAATVVIFITFAYITAGRLKDRIGIFFWTTAIWDITYYVYLWITIRWPNSLTSPDVFFLIPQPWLGQVWFPILVSSLTALVVFTNTKASKK